MNTSTWQPIWPTSAQSDCVIYHWFWIMEGFPNTQTLVPVKSNKLTIAGLNKKQIYVLVSARTLKQIAFHLYWCNNPPEVSVYCIQHKAWFLYMWVFKRGYIEHATFRKARATRRWHSSATAANRVQLSRHFDVPSSWTIIYLKISHIQACKLQCTLHCAHTVKEAQKI